MFAGQASWISAFQRLIAHSVSLLPFRVSEALSDNQILYGYTFNSESGQKDTQASPKTKYSYAPWKKGKRHKGELNPYLQYFHCFSASHNYVCVIK